VSGSLLDFTLLRRRRAAPDIGLARRTRRPPTLFNPDSAIFPLLAPDTFM
jgi:hypothetical protein